MFLDKNQLMSLHICAKCTIFEKISSNIDISIQDKLGGFVS